MGLDALLAKLQREAVTPVTPSIPLGVTAKALPLLAVPLVTPVTPKNSNAGEKAEPGHSRQAETGKSLTRPYLSEVSGGSGVQASIGKASGVTPGVTDGVTGVTARGELPTVAAEPIERDLDDRRFCTECGNLRSGVCTVARPGGLVSAIRGYRPASPGVLQRCAGYSPRASVT